MAPRVAALTALGCVLFLTLLSACNGQETSVPVVVDCNSCPEPGLEDRVCVDGVQFKSLCLADRCAGALGPDSQIIGGDCNILQTIGPVIDPISLPGEGIVPPTDPNQFPQVMLPDPVMVTGGPIALPTTIPTIPTVLNASVPSNTVKVNTIGVTCLRGDSGTQCLMDPCMASSSPCKDRAGYKCYPNYCSNGGTIFGIPVKQPGCSAVFIKLGQKSIAAECYPREVPGITCSKGDRQAQCFAEPCRVSNSPCQDKPGFQCVNNYCTNSTSYLGTKLPPGFCTALYVNTMTLKVATECTPDVFPCKCPKILLPVCGKDGVTYNNICLAKCAGAGVQHVGKCKPPCICTQIFAPVCGVDGKTYSNECTAKCAGVAVKYTGECQTVACRCANIGPEVCGVNGKTYPNACSAACELVDVAYEGPCKPSPPKCLPEGLACTTTANKCCTGLTCSTGPVAVEGVTNGTCLSNPPRG